MRFAELFPEKAGDIEINSFSPESLAALAYSQELELKNKALKALLQDGKIQAPLSPVVPSPMPRGYRTTGKRRVTYANGKLFWNLKSIKRFMNSATKSSLIPDTKPLLLL